MRIFIVNIYHLYHFVVIYTEAATRDVLWEKGVLRNFAKFTGKHLCQSLSFNKVADLSPAKLLKKMLWRRCFPVNFAKFLRTPFLQNTSGRLLLSIKLLMILKFIFMFSFRSVRWVTSLKVEKWFFQYLCNIKFAGHTIMMNIVKVKVIDTLNVEKLRNVFRSQFFPSKWNFSKFFY